MQARHRLKSSALPSAFGMLYGRDRKNCNNVNVCINNKIWLSLACARKLLNSIRLAFFSFCFAGCRISCVFLLLFFYYCFRCRRRAGCDYTKMHHLYLCTAFFIFSRFEIFSFPIIIVVVAVITIPACTLYTQYRQTKIPSSLFLYLSLKALAL